MSDFMYYNANVNKKIISDCVTKAIKIATGLEYFTVAKLLDLASEHTGHDRLTMQSYRYLLEDVFGFPVFYPEKGETVEDIIDKYPRNTIIIRVSGHLLVAVDGTILDLFNSDYRRDVTCYWIAK